jgi:hypothetical protein
MPNAADLTAAAQAAINLSDALVVVSQTLVDIAHDRMTATPPGLTLDQYRELVMHHAAVVGNAATIRQATALDLGRDVQKSIAALKDASDTLKARTKTLSDIQNLVDRDAKVLVAVGSLATLIASPSLMTIGAVISAAADVAK